LNTVLLPLSGNPTIPQLSIAFTSHKEFITQGVEVYDIDRTCNERRRVKCVNGER